MPPIIQGNLNFGGVPSMTNVQANYEQSYANALSLNQQNYANILSGYQQLMSGQVSAQQAIAQGYQGLSSAVLQDISGIDASQRQAINDVYAAQSGQQAQGLISRGLGNTTVANSVQRGLLAEKNKADIALSNQMAQLTAGYRSQLGLAGLNQANQANMQNTALGSQQLGWMNSINAPYPNAAEYYKLLAMQAQLRRGAFGGLGPGSVPMQAQRQQGLVGIRPMSQGGSMPGGSAGGGFGYQSRPTQGGTSTGGQYGGTYSGDTGVIGAGLGFLGGALGAMGEQPNFGYQPQQYPDTGLGGAVSGFAGAYGDTGTPGLNIGQAYYEPPTYDANADQTANWDIPYDANADQTQNWDIPYDANADQTANWDVSQAGGGNAWWQDMGLSPNEAANYGDLSGAVAGFGGDLGQNFNDYYAASSSDYGGDYGGGDYYGGDYYGGDY